MNRDVLLEKLVVETDELRRLQIVTRKPPNMHEARALREAEVKVDTLLEEIRLPDPASNSTASPTTPSA